MNFRRFTALFLSAATAVTAVSMPSSLDFLSSTVYAEDSAWSEVSSGVWSYTYTDSSQDIPWLDINIEGKNWEEIKYVSADITVTGTASAAFGGKPTDADWYNCDNKVIEDEDTIYLMPDGMIFESLEINFDKEVTNEGATITISNIVFSTEERDYSDVTGEWYKQNGNWYYRNGDTAVSEIPGLPLDLSETDWSTVKYISADISTSGKAQPVIDINFDGTDEGWTSGSPKNINNGTGTVYYNTNSETPVEACISFWWYEEGVALAANQLVTVSNIVFSTEERDYSDIIGEWYSPEEGKWCYRNGDKALAEQDVPVLELPMQDYVSDWSKIKYISAKVEVEGSVRAVMGGGYDDEWIDSPSVTINNGSDVVMLYTDGKVFDINNVNFWNMNDSSEAISANAFITISEITVSETYPTDYTNIVGQWVKTGDNQYYYNHGDKSDIAYVEGLVLDCPYDIADVQSISITAKVVMTGGTPDSIKLVVTGQNKNGEEFIGYNFPFGTDEETVVRKYRGNVASHPCLDISFGQEDLAVIKNGGTVEIYVTDISYSTEPIDITYSTPNDLLVDDNETDITDDNEHDIMYHDISRIETTGTLKIYTKNIGSTQDINVFWREWSDFSNITKLETTPIAMGNGVYEIKVTEEALNIIHEKAPKACELALTGTGYRFLKATFTPDSDATPPSTEEITPEAVPETDKAQLEQSKNNTIDETKAPESADEMEYNKVYGHKSGLKKHKKGHNVYGLRIAQRVEKKLLQHAESVTITVYSKKSGQFITLTAETCFSHLNINGFKVKANDKDAFLTVVLDNIPEDDEITFTSFKINYKK